MASRRTITQQRFRLREDLLAKLRRAAKANDRSLNDEVELRLLDSLTKDTVAKTVKAATAELINETARATADAWIDQPIEAELARGEPNLAIFPWWMLVNWAKRHHEHPEAVRIMERFEKWIRQSGAPTAEEVAEAERFVEERFPRRSVIGKTPRGKSKE
jgi:hypothetical protein